MTDELVTGYVQVVERGVRWVPEQEQPSSFATEQVFIAQAPGESAATLAARVVRHAEGLSSNATPVECAVIAVSGSGHADVLASRYEMARGLLRAMGGVAGARLFFTSPSPSGEARHTLLSMAGILLAEHHHRSAEICFRFGTWVAAMGAVVSVRQHGRFATAMRASGGA